MKHTLILIAFAFALVLPMTVAAGQQVGDNATIIVPTGKIADLRQVLIVKGTPKPAATDVGNCADGGVHLQDAQLVDREPPAGRGGRGAKGPLPTVSTEVAIVVPGVTGFKELKPGWHLGSYRPGGKCGPGYDIYLAHIIAIDDKAER
jgi:hypothetical protein